MNNLIKRFKRGLAILVSFTTLAWAIGPAVLLLPTRVAAADAKPGDLIKMSGLSSVYYLGADNKRYVFPNETTFKSWFKDFSSVKTIAQSELESYSLGSNATIRPGTKLVKITTDPKVYAIEGAGVLKWIPTEATAKTLYGDNWAKKVVDVPDSYFTNYTVSSEQVSATAYPAGTLIKYASSSDIYLVTSATQARKIATTDAFNANRYKDEDVITAPSTITYTYGTDITAAESSLIDPSRTGVIPSNGQTGTGLTVALSSTTPGAASIIADSDAGEYPQSLIPFTTVNFTAGNDGDVTVTQVKFTRTGIAADSDIGNLYLYDGATKLAEYNSFSDKVASFNNSTGLFIVTKGTTKTITLKGDLARNSTASVTSGKTIGFKVAAAADVTAGSAVVSGTFPVSGNEMSTASVNNLGDLTFAGASGSNGSYPTSVKADDAGKELWSVNATAADQNIQIKYLKFTMVGTVASTDIKNIKLEVAGTQVGEAKSLGADNTLVYDLASTPIAISSGVTKAIALRGDMAGGSGRTFKFTIQKSADVVVYDTNYGVYVSPSVNSATTAFGIVQPTAGTGTSVDSGSLTLGLATDSPIGNIADAATGLTLAKFSFYAAGEAVKIESLTIKCAGSDTSSYIDNVKALVDGVQVGSTDTTLKCDDGTDTTTFTLGNTFVVPASTTKNLTIVADTADSTVDPDDTYTISITTYTAVGQSTLNSITATTQAGRTLTIKAGTASAVKNSAFANRSSSNPTGTVNQIGAQIASFIITAGSGEAIDVTQIKLIDKDGTTPMGEDFQNLVIKHEGTQIGSTVSSLNTSSTATNYTFTPSTAIRIAAGGQYVVDVYADIKSTILNGSTDLAPVLKFASVTAQGVNTGASASYDPTDFDLQTAHIVASGNLTITQDGNTPSSIQMIMGATDQEVARFKLTADSSEAISISDIYVAATVNSGATGTFQNLKLYVDGAQVGTATNFGSTSTTTYAVAPFTGLSLTVPKSGNKVLVVKADVSTYPNASSGDTATFALLPDYDGSTSGNQEAITAKGSASGVSITAAKLDFTATSDTAISGNQMTVYATKISVAFATDTPSGSVYATGGDDQQVAKFVVTNSANVGSYAATLKYMNLAITQSGTSKAANTAVEVKVYKNNSLTSTNLVGTTSFAAAANSNIGDTAFTNGTSNATNFIDTDITAGESQTFIVTMDTNGLSMDADTGAESISIGMADSDIAWRDGVITSDITSVNSLPLSAKTLSYPAT